MFRGQKWWSILTSMKTGLYLLVLVILASAVGTLYPQGQQLNGLERYLQMGDVYHSWWYVTLLALLALNLIVCNISRMKAMFNNLFDYRSLLEADRVMKLKLHSCFLRKEDISVIRNGINNLLAGQNYEVWWEKGPSPIKMGAQKGRLYTMGSFLTHLSFVVILLGALYGGFFGFKGMVTAPIGSTFYLSQVPGMKGSSVNDISIRVDKFWVERYPDGTPLGYFSRLTVIKDQEAKKTATIAVNHPLEFEGVKVYQASYGQMAGVKVYQGGTTKNEMAQEGDFLALQGTDYHLLIYSYDPPAGLYGDTVGTQHSIIYAVYEKHNLLKTGKAQADQVINIDDKGNSFLFTGFVPTTGLQVKKDPGVPIVIAGSILILIGIGMITLLQPRKIWAVLEKQEEGVHIVIGGNCRKNMVAFEEEFRHLVAELKLAREEDN